MIRKGLCNRCGSCCKGVTLTLHPDPNHPEREKRVTSYKKFLDLHGVIYTSQADGRIEIRVGNRCKALDVEEGKAVCKEYVNRPIVCQEFPLGPNPICVGFTFEEEPEVAPKTKCKGCGTDKAETYIMSKEGTYCEKCAAGTKEKKG